MDTAGSGRSNRSILHPLTPGRGAPYLSTAEGFGSAALTLDKVVMARA